MSATAWSLFEIMCLFDLHQFTQVLHACSQVEMALLLPKMSGQGSQPVPDVIKTKMEWALRQSERLLAVSDLPECVADVATAKRQWQRPLLDASSGCEIAHRLQADIVEALARRQFLKVPEDRLNLIPHMKGDERHEGITDIIGSKVIAAFPSCWDDVYEAGHCLAADCNTGGVFHLMRVAEVGLRAVASDRKASFANKPIDQQEWGTILGYLDGAIKNLRAAPSSSWNDPGIKDVQIRFYSEVVAELRGFNEAWRRHLSHAREDGIYDHDRASSIFKHVVTFMQKLAEKIGETKTTPEYWTV
jgi:hypothetical protein